MLPEATFSAQQPASASLPLLPEDAVATSSHLQQFSAVRKLTRDLQQQGPRYPIQPKLSPCEAGTPTKRIVFTAVYKQKFTQYEEALNNYEHCIDQLLSEQSAEVGVKILVLMSMLLETIYKHLQISQNQNS